MALTVKDLEKLQCQLDGDYRLKLVDGDRLTVPDLLPGWEVAMSELWSPVFDQE